MSIEKKLNTIAETVTQWITPLGYRIIDVEFQTHQQPLLRLTIDWDKKEDPITIENIMQVHKTLNPKNDPLDRLDMLIEEISLIHTAYDLEISSPGIQRKIQRPEDFLRFYGKRVKIIAKSPIALDEKKKCRSFLGILQETDAEGFYFMLEKPYKTLERIYMPWSNLSKANLEPELPFTGEHPCQN